MRQRVLSIKKILFLSFETTLIISVYKNLSVEGNKRDYVLYCTQRLALMAKKRREGWAKKSVFEKEDDEYRLLGLDRARTTEVYLKRDARYIDEERVGRKIIEVYL